jgi:putative ABC transport system permease protein
MRRRPSLTAAATITLALGIGANTAIFSAVNAVVLRPLPFVRPDRLFMVWEENPEKGWYKNVAAPANYLDWKEQVPAFLDVAAYDGWLGRSTLVLNGTPTTLGTATVTGNLFAVLGVRAERGRTFRSEETWRNGAPVAVVSHRLWRDRFGGDPALVGRTIQLDGRAVQVVGVMPNTFAFPWENVDVWTPSAWDPANRVQVFFRRAHWLRVIARLAPTATPDEASAQLRTVVDRLRGQYPATNKFMGAGMTPLHEFLVGDTRLPLLILLGAVGLLLLIACANVGNLLLVRASEREREVSVRLALGAGRGRIVRQAITESLVLSVIGGAAGLAIGAPGTRWLVGLQPDGLLRVHQFGVDWAVLAFVAALTTISGVLFGIAPALWFGRRAPAEALRSGGRTGTDGQRMRRWGNTLVVAEVALSLMLTVGAGLLVRSFNQLLQENPGFDPNGVLTVSLDLPSPPYDTPAQADGFYDRLLDRLRALPGVTMAGATLLPPLTGTGWTSDFTAAGRAANEYGTEVAHRVVSADYFRTLRVPLRRGRLFSETDRRDGPPVVVINESLARSYFRGQDPIGQRMTFSKVADSSSTWSTIVGVVGDEHQVSLATPPQIEVFHPFSQQSTGSRTVVIRAGRDPASLGPAVRRVVAELDPMLAIARMRTMDEIRDISLAQQRFLLVLLSMFAGVGLVLAVVGVYGVLAQVARQRMREMGIRIALGAPVTRVRWLVVRHGLRLTVAGLVIGSVAAAYATRAMEKLLFRIKPGDPLTFVSVPLLLAATALVAAWLPARRASTADPAVTLRGE